MPVKTTCSWTWLKISQKLCFGAYSYLDTASCHIATCTGMPVKTYHHWLLFVSAGTCLMTQWHPQLRPDVPTVVMGDFNQTTRLDLCSYPFRPQPLRQLITELTHEVGNVLILFSWISVTATLKKLWLICAGLVWYAVLYVSELL